MLRNLRLKPGPAGFKITRIRNFYMRKVLTVTCANFVTLSEKLTQFNMAILYTQLITIVAWITDLNRIK